MSVAALVGSELGWNSGEVAGGGGTSAVSTTVPVDHFPICASTGRALTQREGCSVLTLVPVLVFVVLVFVVLVVALGWQLLHRTGAQRAPTQREGRPASLPVTVAEPAQALHPLAPLLVAALDPAVLAAQARVDSRLGVESPQAPRARTGSEHNHSHIQAIFILPMAPSHRSTRWNRGGGTTLPVTWGNTHSKRPARTALSHWPLPCYRHRH